MPLDTLFVRNLYYFDAFAIKKSKFHLPIQTLLVFLQMHNRFYCKTNLWKRNNIMNQQIFNEIQALKRKILPENGKLILFGSQARGDALPNSDWDLLVLLDKEKKSFEDEDIYSYPFTELGWNYGVAINSVLATKKHFEKNKNFPFYENIIADGIEIK